MIISIFEMGLPRYIAKSDVEFETTVMSTTRYVQLSWNGNAQSRLITGKLENYAKYWIVHLSLTFTLIFETLANGAVNRH